MPTRLDSPQPLAIEEIEAIRLAARNNAAAVLQKQWDRYASRQDIYYDEKLAQAAVDFFPRFLRHSKGALKGKPFVLEPWQEKIIRIIWGFRWKSNGLRVVRRLFLFVAKKNGKSTFCAGLILLLLIGDAENGAEVYGAANTKNQARIVFNEAASMVQASPALKKITTTFKTSIYCNQLSSGYQVISSIGADADGYNPHGFVIDELHHQRNRELYEFLKHGTVARPQSLQIYMTTAGDNKRSICGEVYDDARRILSGEVDEIGFLPILFEAEKEDDWKDPLTWAKANPSLGVDGAVRPDDLLTEAREAARKPRVLNKFLRLHVNRWVTSLVCWIPSDVIYACRGPVPWQKLPEHLLGRPCFGGVDLASNQDITAWVKLFPPFEDDPYWYIVPRFYLPGDNMPDRVSRDHVEYDVWHRQGAIKLTAGDRMDFDYIVADIEADAPKYLIEEIPYDRAQASIIAPRLNGMGLPMVEYAQGYAGMSAPTKLIESLMHQGMVRHGGHPVLEWMFGNVALERNFKEDVFPSKKKSAEKIDGVVAAIMAFGRATTRPHEVPPAEPRIFYV